jgi:hypothetical protein
MLGIENSTNGALAEFEETIMSCKGQREQLFI